MDMLEDKRVKRDDVKVFKLIKELEDLISSDVNTLPSYEDFNKRFNETMEELEKLITG